MGVKEQNIKTIYKRNLSFSIIIQSISWLVILLGFESLYLFGSNSIFDSDISYLIIISILLLILYIKNLTGNYLYWYLRPKLSASFFQNITNILVIALFTILGFLLSTNELENSELNLKTFGSVTLMLSLPIVFYFWLALQRIAKKSINLELKNESFKRYLSIEPYIYLLTFAIFGILFDFLPQDYTSLVVIPIVIAITFVILDSILNRFILSWTFSIVQKKNAVIEQHDVHNSIFELNPYVFFDNLERLYQKQTKKNKVDSVNIIRSFSLIDKIDDVKIILSNETDPELKLLLKDVIKQLEFLKKEVKKIGNPYEFVEQSSNLLLINALIRTQINNCDQNLLIKLLNDNRASVSKAACIVAGYFNDINYISILINHLENPLTNIYAQFALKNIGEKVVKYLEIEYSKRKSNIFFVESCFDILSAIPSPNAHNLLFISLNEQDKSIVKIAAKNIINCYETASEERRKYFSTLFDNLIINTISNHFIINEINKMNKTFYVLKRAFQDENKENIYLIENLLKLYYDKNIVDRIFYLYQKDNTESHLLVYNLIDKMIGNINIANKIKSLFSPNDSRIKEFILEEYPFFEFNQSYENEETLIWGILNKNYDEINNWTRASAINTLQYLHSEDIPFELAAEFLNANLLLKETAAISIYKNIPEFYTIYLDRLSKKEATSIDFIVRSNTDSNSLGNLRTDNLLLYNKIQFLASIPYLKELTINEITTFHSYFKPIVLESGNHQINLKDESTNGYWIIETGEPKYSTDGLDYIGYKKRDIIEVNGSSSKYAEHIFIQTDQPVRILIVEKIILLNLLQNSHRIIDESLNEISDFSSKISFSNESKIKVA